MAVILVYIAYPCWPHIRSAVVASSISSGRKPDDLCQLHAADKNACRIVPDLRTVCLGVRKRGTLRPKNAGKVPDLRTVRLGVGTSRFRKRLAGQRAGMETGRGVRRGDMRDRSKISSAHPTLQKVALFEPRLVSGASASLRWSLGPSERAQLFIVGHTGMNCA